MINVKPNANFFSCAFKQHCIALYSPSGDKVDIVMRV